MPRDYEIMIAFGRAIQHDTTDRQTVSTLDFMKGRELVKWYYMLRAANKCIETHTTTFRYISPIEGEGRLFHLYNPNGGI